MFHIYGGKNMEMLLKISILGMQITTLELALAISTITIGLLWFGFLVGWLWLKRKRGLQKKQDKEV